MGRDPARPIRPGVRLQLPVLQAHGRWGGRDARHGRPRGRAAEPPAGGVLRPELALALPPRGRPGLARGRGQLPPRLRAADVEPDRVGAAPADGTGRRPGRQAPGAIPPGRRGAGGLPHPPPRPLGQGAAGAGLTPVRGPDPGTGPARGLRCALRRAGSPAAGLRARPGQFPLLLELALHPVRGLSPHARPALSARGRAAAAVARRPESGSLRQRDPHRPGRGGCRIRRCRRRSWRGAARRSPRARWPRAAPPRSPR